MRNILVPTDFSPMANNALDFAVQIARKSGAKIILLNVIEGVRNYAFNTMGEIENSLGEDEFIIRKLIDQTQENLTKFAEQHQYDGVEFSTMIEMGGAYASISKVIAENKTDLIVMGTKGSSGIEEVLIGSNTEKVVRYSSCPVITIKEKVDLNDIDNIVFATNLMEDQSELIAPLKVLQEVTNAKLHLVKVNTPNHFHTQRQMDEEFKNFVAKHELNNATTTVYNEATEEDGILYFAEDLGECMIAIGTHGRTGLLHLLSGSIAEDLVNHARIPVWTLSMRNKK